MSNWESIVCKNVRLDDDWILMLWCLMPTRLANRFHQFICQFFFLVLELQSCLVPVCKLSASDWETQVNKSND